MLLRIHIGWKLQMRRFANVSRIERCYNGGKQSTDIHNHGMVEMIMIAKWDVILDYRIKYTIYFVKITHCVLASTITYPAPLIVPTVISLSIMHQWQYAVCMMMPSNGNISALQWRGALMFSLICAWINRWVNNREAGHLRRHRAHYDVFVMINCRKVHGKRCKENGWSSYVEGNYYQIF